MSNHHAVGNKELHRNVERCIWPKPEIKIHHRRAQTKVKIWICSGFNQNVNSYVFPRFHLASGVVRNHSKVTEGKGSSILNQSAISSGERQQQDAWKHLNTVIAGKHFLYSAMACRKANRFVLWKQRRHADSMMERAALTVMSTCCSLGSTNERPWSAHEKVFSAPFCNFHATLYADKDSQLGHQEVMEPGASTVFQNHQASIIYHTAAFVFHPGHHFVSFLLPAEL